MCGPLGLYVLEDKQLRMWNRYIALKFLQLGSKADQTHAFQCFLLTKACDLLRACTHSGIARAQKQTLFDALFLKRRGQIRFSNLVGNCLQVPAEEFSKMVIFALRDVKQGDGDGKFAVYMYIMLSRFARHCVFKNPNLGVEHATTAYGCADKNIRDQERTAKNNLAWAHKANKNVKPCMKLINELLVVAQADWKTAIEKQAPLADIAAKYKQVEKYTSYVADSNSNDYKTTTQDNELKRQVIQGDDIYLLP